MHGQVAAHDQSDGQEYLVDADLKVLLERAWELGIGTTNSCQENQPGIAWIEFFRAPDAELFFEILDAQDHQLWLEAQDSDWNFTWNLGDLAEVLDEELDEVFPGDLVEPILHPSMRFPCRHIERTQPALGRVLAGRH